MSIFNLFSKRQNELRAEPTDILTYSSIPNQLRVQIVHVITDTIGREHHSYSTNPIEEAYKYIHDVLCREYGLFDLGPERTYEDRIANFILKENNVEKVLDVIELSFRYAKLVIDQNYNYNNLVVRKMMADPAIEELNERFKQHAIGFQYIPDEIIKLDSTYIHAEIVKPVLSLLNVKEFKGANEEYLKAHEHYRHGRNKECLSECLKAFESTMKIIYTLKNWSFDAKATSSTLVKVAFDNNLIPAYLQSQFSSLRSLLDSGINTIRNRIGGHGQGAMPTIADDETTRFTLNLTGTCIIYLIELSKFK